MWLKISFIAIHVVLKKHSPRLYSESEANASELLENLNVLAIRQDYYYSNAIIYTLLYTSIHI